jgi:hypothetical protein
MLKVVDGPSVQALQSVFINFNHLLLLSLLNLILYLQLTFLSARVKTDASTIDKEEQMILFCEKTAKTN